MNHSLYQRVLHFKFETALLFVNASAANTPFGHFTTERKFAAGQQLANRQWEIFALFSSLILAVSIAPARTVGVSSGIRCKEHLADEIENVGKSEQRELASLMIVLLAYLLKWQYQPGQRGSNWETTIKTPAQRHIPSHRQVPRA